MRYVAFYREWRPQSFQEVVGQKHVVRTLQNAIIQGRISHAYLFCGPRGTGKTSLAKIFAKVVNCTAPNTGEPCGACVNCAAISAGNALDVLEIDAASNRGIDEIRELRERVQYTPALGKFRVYIIDEVHMLTTEAFNALLKTLEEPPRHVIFILATTEAHKVPATILSRCQRFDFRRLSLTEMVERLQLVASTQNIVVSEEALLAIVRAADGGMRDALSLFEQCVGFAEAEEVCLADVHQVLGIVSEEYFAQTLAGIMQNNPADLLGIVEEISRQGKDLRRFIRDFIGYLRDLLFLQVGNQERDQFVVVSEYYRDQLSKQANQGSTQQTIQLINYFTRLETEMKWAIQPRWLLEATLVEAAEHRAYDPLAQLEQRITLLEQTLQGNKRANPLPVPTAELALPEPNAGHVDADEANGENSPSPKLLGQQGQQAVDSGASVSGASVSGVSAVSGEEMPSIQENWKSFMDALRKRSVAVHALVLEAEPTECRGDKVVLSFRPGRHFHCQKMNEESSKKVVEEVLAQFFQRTLCIQCKMQETEKVEEKSAEKPEAAEEEGAKDPLIQEAIRVFGTDRIKII